MTSARAQARRDAVRTVRRCSRSSVRPDSRTRDATRQETTTDFSQRRRWVLKMSSCCRTEFGWSRRRSRGFQTRCLRPSYLIAEPMPTGLPIWRLLRIETANRRRVAVYYHQPRRSHIGKVSRFRQDEVQNAATRRPRWLTAAWWRLRLAQRVRADWCCASKWRWSWVRPWQHHRCLQVRSHLWARLRLNCRRPFCDQRRRLAAAKQHVLRQQDLLTGHRRVWDSVAVWVRLKLHRSVLQTKSNEQLLCLCGLCRPAFRFRSAACLAEPSQRTAACWSRPFEPTWRWLLWWPRQLSFSCLGYLMLFRFYTKCSATITWNSTVILTTTDDKQNDNISAACQRLSIHQQHNA